MNTDSPTIEYNFAEDIGILPDFNAAKDKKSKIVNRIKESKKQVNQGKIKKLQSVEDLD